MSLISLPVAGDQNLLALQDLFAFPGKGLHGCLTTGRLIADGRLMVPGPFVSHSADFHWVPDVTMEKEMNSTDSILYPLPALVEMGDHHHSRELQADSPLSCRRGRRRNQADRGSPGHHNDLLDRTTTKADFPLRS